MQDRPRNRHVGLTQVSIPSGDFVSNDAVISQKRNRHMPCGRLAPKLVLLISTVTLVLLISEAMTRILFWHSLDFDMEMWKYATQVKVASSDPNLGHKHGPNRDALLMGVRVTTNQFGLRGGATTLRKPEKTYRILVVGDSLTMGWGVEQDQTFSAVLERRMNAEPPHGFPASVRYEVLNLGVGNYNTVQEVTLLRSVGLQFDPDLILLAYFINDAEPTTQVRYNYLLEHSYLCALLASRLRRLPFGTGSLSYKDYYRGLYTSGQPGWLAEQAAFRELAKLAQHEKIPIIVYILPELHDLSAAYPFLDIHQEVAKFVAGLGLPIVDLLPEFSGYSPEINLWVTPTDAHPNAIAHSIIAKGIHNSLASALPGRTVAANSLSSR